MRNLTTLRRRACAPATIIAAEGAAGDDLVDADQVPTGALLEEVVLEADAMEKQRVRNENAVVVASKLTRGDGRDTWRACMAGRPARCCPDCVR